MDPVRFRLRVFLVALVLVVVAGAVAFALLEDLSPLDAVYYIVVTIATVGYGDIHPTSDAGKVLAMLLILAGAGLFVGVFANVAELFLNRHEKRARMQKLHFVEGVFYSEVGTELLRRFALADPDVNDLQGELGRMERWATADVEALVKRLKVREYAVDADRLDLSELHRLLSRNRDLLLRVLENPSLHEHEAFSDLLRAVFHLTEELASRPAFEGLPPSDVKHLALDVRRAYGYLVPEWVSYMGYLRREYPYLFHLAVRTNPFDREASPVVAV